MGLSSGVSKSRDCSEQSWLSSKKAPHQLHFHVKWLRRSWWIYLVVHRVEVGQEDGAQAKKGRDPIKLWKRERPYKTLRVKNSYKQKGRFLKTFLVQFKSSLDNHFLISILKWFLEWLIECDALVWCKLYYVNRTDAPLGKCIRYNGEHQPQTYIRQPIKLWPSKECYKDQSGSLAVRNSYKPFLIVSLCFDWLYYIGVVDEWDEYAWTLKLKVL